MVSNTNTSRARDRAVAKAEQTEAAPEQSGPTLRQNIERMSTEIGRALPSHISTERFTRIALTLVRQNPMLLQCSQQSVLGALMLAAQHGLEPGPLGLSYIIPRWNRKTGTHEANFQIGYKGILELARRSGQCAMIDAEIVGENDEFYYEKGLNPTLRHVPSDDDPGKPVRGWAAATFTNGGSAFKVLSVKKIEEYRKRSQSPNQGPWVTDWDAMACKTVLLRLAPFLPLSPEAHQVIAADEGTVTELPLGDDPVQIDHPDPIDVGPADTDPETGETTPPDNGQADGEAAQQELGGEAS